MTLEERIATPPPKRSPKSSKPVPHQDLILENLPFEILYAIANHAGFFPTLKLMHTSRFFRTLFQSRSAWLSYMDPTACSDQIENMVLVQTKISLFDHVLFGVWNGTGEGKKAGVREEEVFFEHRAFNEEFDFLGGVSVGLGRSGFGRATFFEHRDTLPCYQNDLKERVRTGQIPPSIPPVTPVMTSISSPTSAHIPIPRGAKIEHSCSECAHFDHQKILKSICLLDHNHHPNLHALENAIAWDYTYPDGRRTLKYRILSHTGILGYGAARDLPMVHVNKVYINGVQLTGWAHDFYKRVVG
ncbi:hypothetical protein DFS34DRAFT_583135 [Phlyctochytrium arcticum]|nr:hypothetical protein DFS34DRAFT_583135 [Phlyctochytrium arcticum]